MRTEGEEIRIEKLQEELKKLQAGKNGDLFRNNFGSVAMLLEFNHIAYIRSDGNHIATKSKRVWKDIVEDPYFKKIGNVHDLLSEIYCEEWLEDEKDFRRIIKYKQRRTWRIEDKINKE